jgi:hypothetical protein
MFKTKGTPLEYSKYKEYYVDVEEEWHWVFRFPNDYGASVIKRFGSYGYEEDKFELAVLAYDGESVILAYNTPITDDVLGYLTNEEVLELLEKIKCL